MRQQSVHPDPHNPDKAVNAEQPSLSAFSWHTGDKFNFRALLSPSLQGTIGTVPEPSYHVNSWPLESDSDKREVLGASMLLKVAEDKRQEYVAALMEAEQAQRVAEDIKDRALTRAIQAARAEKQAERQTAALKAAAEKELGATANDGICPLLAGGESFPLLADAEVLDRPSDDGIDRCMSKAHNEETEIKRRKSK